LEKVFLINFIKECKKECKELIIGIIYTIPISGGKECNEVKQSALHTKSVQVGNPGYNMGADAVTAFLLWREHFGCKLKNHIRLFVLTEK
jgi:hypothetical protein